MDRARKLEAEAQAAESYPHFRIRTIRDEVVTTHHQDGWV